MKQNMQAMMKQAQKMQADMLRAQEELKDERVEASVGGGAVKVVMTGELQIESVTIDPDAVDAEDIGMLEDMVAAAVNEAVRQAQDLAARKMQAVTGGLGLPGGSSAMAFYAPPIARLLEELERLPGIGPKSAQRLAYHILRGDTEAADRLADAIVEVKRSIRFCERCFNFAESDRCAICADPARDETIICVVEEPRDVVAVERTGEFRGTYHVLQGAISPIDGIGPEQLRVRELIDRLGREQIAEVILQPTRTSRARRPHSTSRVS